MYSGHFCHQLLFILFCEPKANYTGFFSFLWKYFNKMFYKIVKNCGKKCTAILEIWSSSVKIQYKLLYNRVFFAIVMKFSDGFVFTTNTCRNKRMKAFIEECNDHLLFQYNSCIEFANGCHGLNLNSSLSLWLSVNIPAQGRRWQF